MFPCIKFLKNTSRYRSILFTIENLHTEEIFSAVHTVESEWFECSNDIRGVWMWEVLSTLETVTHRVTADSGTVSLRVLHLWVKRRLFFLSVHSYCKDSSLLPASVYLQKGLLALFWTIFQHLSSRKLYLLLLLPGWLSHQAESLATAAGAIDIFSFLVYWPRPRSHPSLAYPSLLFSEERGLSFSFNNFKYLK